MLVNAKSIQTEDTIINAFASNDDGGTFESIVLGTFHTFTSSSDKPEVKFCLNSTDNLSSSYIPNYRIQIVPSSPPSLFIDVGNDGIIDMDANFELNSTTTPINYNGTDIGFNNYINRTCKGLSHCSVPVSLTLGGGGTIQLSDLNATQNINPVRLNVTPIQDSNQIILDLSYTSGTVQLSDVRFDYRGRENITVVAHSGDYSTSLNRTIFVEHSTFDVTILPQSIDFWDISPNIYSWTQNNIPPFGNANGNGNPFWNVTKNTWDHPIDIYVRYNESVNTCQDTWFVGNQTITLNTSAQLIVDNITINNLEHNISTFTNISCASINSTLLIPYNCWNSLCSACTITPDAFTNCEMVN